MKSKLKAWFIRYFPAEILATLGAFGGAAVAYYITENGIVAAYAGTLSENVGFYGYIITRDILESKTHHKNANSNYTFKSLIKNIRNIIIEFGSAEALDSLLVRPFAMYIFPIILGNFALGIIIGKFVADIIFYIPAIIAYELRKKHLID